jgi:transcriptional regulator with XRE-family HTH domain
MAPLKTTQEWEAELGSQIRSLRLRKNLDQRALAAQAGIALGSLKNLESGKGTTLATLLKALRALDRLDWLQALAPTVSISPLQLINQKAPRQRASSPRKTSRTPSGS